MADISDEECVRLLRQAAIDANVTAEDSLRITHNFIKTEHGAKSDLEAVQYWNKLTKQQKVDLTRVVLGL